MKFLKFGWANLPAAIAFTFAATCAPAQAAAGDPKKFSVTLTGLVVEPDGKSLPVGTETEVKEHDVIVQGKLSWFATARLEAPAVVRAVDVDFKVAPETTLRLAAGASGGDLASLSRTAVTYCDELRTDRAKALGQLATLGLSTLGSRLSKETQICLVDSDGNQDFDKGFIVGIKKAPDLHMVEIQPVKYTTKRLDPLAGESWLKVKFYDGGIMSGPSLGMELKINGATQGYAALHMFELGRLSLAGRMRAVPNQGFKEKNLPKLVGFGPTRITVLSFDKARKVGKVRVERDWVPTGFVIQYPPQVIYVYY